MKKEQKIEEQDGFPSELVPCIIRQGLQIQEQGANFLQHQAEKLSKKVKRFALFTFCLLSGGYSFYLIASSFTSPQNKAILTTPTKISVPTSQMGKENLPPAEGISPEEWQKRQRFGPLPDSLTNHPSGKKPRNSIY